MADEITAKGSGAQYRSHPEGQFVGTCVDTIDLGEKVEEFPGAPAKLAHKCVLVFRTGERNEDTSDYIDIAREFTVSMNEKSNLRKFLEQWRGKPYTAAQIDEGVPLHKLTGNPGLLTVAHRTSAAGRTYANLTACVGVPKQMASTVTKYEDYKRAEYWDQRKKEYADAARKFKSDAGAEHGEFEDFPGAGEDDDLPFD